MAKNDEKTTPTATEDETTTPSTTTEGAKVSDAAPVPAQGEHYEKGYIGFVPSRDGDNPVDLTLAAVTKGA